MPKLYSLPSRESSANPSSKPAANASARAGLGGSKRPSASDLTRKQTAKTGQSTCLLEPKGLSRLLLLNKPWGVLTQFTDEQGRATLADYVDVPGVYPAGRLDRDSEGLLLLTNDGRLQARIAQPAYKMEKTYWAQVEGEAGEAELARLTQGVMLNDGMTLPATAQRLPEDVEQQLWPRNPPVRFRQNSPTSWIELTISEGRNRQVRRMTAAVGLPTLRLVRVRIGPWQLDGLPLGQWREESVTVQL